MNKFEKKLKECTDPTIKEALQIAAKQYVDEWPKVGDKYWHFYSGGEVGYYFWINDETDERHEETGNIFRNREDAEKHVKYLKAKTKVLNAIAKHRGDWRPDWENRNQPKFYLQYGYYTSGWSITQEFTQQCRQFPSENYFPASAYDAIRAELSDETIKTYLGVE